MSDRSLTACKMLDKVADFGPLKEWAQMRLSAFIRDFASADPTDSGKLASMHGQAKELLHWLNLEEVVRRETLDGQK